MQKRGNFNYGEQRVEWWNTFGLSEFYWQEAAWESCSAANTCCFSLFHKGSYYVPLPLFYLFTYLFFIFWPCCMAFGILVPWPGIEPASPAGEAWSLNNWTTREVPLPPFYWRDWARNLSIAIGLMTGRAQIWTQAICLQSLNLRFTKVIRDWSESDENVCVLNE